MYRINTILYVSSGGNEQDSPGLRQALRLARDHRASLTLLMVYPDLPGEYRELKTTFREFLQNQLQESLNAARIAMDIGSGELETNLFVHEAEGLPPAIMIIRDAIARSYDLVIKDAEPVEEGRGFKGMDMKLLRKCPCPVWLARPSAHSGDEVRITVAIDPESRDDREQELSLDLLRFSSSLVSSFGGILDVVSCWQYEFEHFLRYKAWMTVSEEELQQNTEETRVAHHAQLEKMLEESGISCEYHLHHMRGKPEMMIPDFIDQRKSDLLVMGSVGRTGIPGFLIGNTAENIFEQTSCSLLALKPEGFESPVG
ncbi:MAG: universal stress protein [Prosthecochloris sp.]|nr:universal stress protein [Prosthecochloris sp.]